MWKRTVLVQVRTETVRMDMLSSVIGSPARADILAVLFGAGPRAWGPSELGRATRRPHQVVERHLRRLVDADLLRVSFSGGRRHYEARADTPAARELAHFIQQARGRIPRIRGMLERLRSPVLSWAVSRPRGGRSAQQEMSGGLDLLVLTGVPRALVRVQLADLIGRGVELHSMSIREWVAHLEKADMFVRRSRRARKLWILGGWAELIREERTVLESRRTLRAVLDPPTDELSDEWDEEWDPFRPLPGPA